MASELTNSQPTDSAIQPKVLLCKELRTVRRTFNEELGHEIYQHRHRKSNQYGLKAATHIAPDEVITHCLLVDKIFPSVEAAKAEGYLYPVNMSKNKVLAMLNPDFAPMHTNPQHYGVYCNSTSSDLTNARLAGKIQTLQLHEKFTVGNKTVGYQQALIATKSISPKTRIRCSYGNAMHSQKLQPLFKDRPTRYSGLKIGRQQSPHTKEVRAKMHAQLKVQRKEKVEEKVRDAENRRTRPLSSRTRQPTASCKYHIIPCSCRTSCVQMFPKAHLPKVRSAREHELESLEVLHCITFTYF